jgi:hypothetical protein
MASVSAAPMTTGSGSRRPARNSDTRMLAIFPSMKVRARPRAARSSSAIRYCALRAVGSLFASEVSRPLGPPRSSISVTSIPLRNARCRNGVVIPTRPTHTTWRMRLRFSRNSVSP